MLNYDLLAACISIIVGSTVYFFYWNRFIASLLGVAFRVSFWNQGASSIWLEIGSIHFAPLAGRILLKDVKYHSSNQTIKIVKTQILWRYWIRKPTTEEDLSNARVGGGDSHKHLNRAHSCRIQISLEGLEWFLYNRTAAYDNIVASMDPDRAAARAESRRRSGDTHEPHRTTTKSSGFEASSLYPPSLVGAVVRPPIFIRKAYTWVKEQLPSLDPKDLLPVGIDATKCAIVCGNGSTPSLLVAEFQRTDGTFGIVQARSKLDFYKQILTFKFQSAVIRYVENEEFQNPMTATGRIVQEHIKASRATSILSYLTYRTFARLWRRLRLYSLTLHKRSGSPGQNNSRAGKGSRKDAEDEIPIGADSCKLEYAIESKILETPVLEVSYYADVVGKVPLEPQQGNSGLEFFDVGNGDLPPEWGIDIVVRGGFFRYGPWADRQRTELQRTFFPPTYQDAECTRRLQPGDQRVWTALKVFVELRDDTTLHIPFREASKDWQWDQTGLPRPKKREPAVIHLIAGDSSTISYIVPMVAGPKGYEPLLEVHLDSIAITSSLNDIRLLTAESCRVRGELPSPIQWNGERQWTFAVSLRQPVIYLLRDHVNMFTDLGKDWVSGPPTDYYRFVPMIYLFEFDMHHFELNMYANDQNIIDKPLVREENAILTIQGPRFHTEAQIPSNVYRPEATSIPFFVEASNLFFLLSLPRWNTHSSNHGNRIGRVGRFRMDASYRYFAEVRNENIEQFKMNIKVRNIAFKALGWTIRYFMVMRDNYLGSFTNFSTLFEYLDKNKRGLPIGDPIELKHREGKANIMQVEILLSLSNGHILLPAGLPGFESSDPTQYQIPGDTGVGACIIITLPDLQMHFRLHDYYMEMSLNLDTISGSIESDCPENKFLSNSGYHATSEHFVVDGIDITANRLFGPQPRTSTYVCIWEIRLGHVKAIMTASEGRILAAAVNAFRLNFADMANAPASKYTLPDDPDVTFLKFSLIAMSATWFAGHAAVELSIPRGLTVDMNDLVGNLHRKVTVLRMPHACITVFITTPSGRHNWLEAAKFSSDANIDIYSSPLGWRHSGNLQSEFVRVQDILTGRAKSIYKHSLSSHIDVPSLHKNGLYLSQPRLSGGVIINQVDSNRGPKNSSMDSPVDQVQHWPHLPHLSDSDGEEGVSEADRDARLAQSRILTPLATLNAEEQSMSSGDESDNEDLTDVETSDSDWSETDGVEMDGKSRLAQYHGITNHYNSRNLKNPSAWDMSPFILTRNLAPPYLSSRDTNAASQNQPFSLTDIAPDTSDAEFDVTIVRIQCRKDLEMRLNPLIALALTRLEEDIATNPLSAELLLDAMTAKFLSDFSGSEPKSPDIPRPSKTLFDIHLSTVSIQLIQLVVGMQGDTTVPNSTFNFNRQATIAMLDFQSHGLHVAGNMVERDTATPPVWTAAGAVHNMSLNLDNIPDRTVSQMGLHRDTSIAIIFTAFRAKIAAPVLDIGMHGVSVSLGHSSPENMASAGFSLVKICEEILGIHKKWKRRDSMSEQYLLYQILVSSADKFVVDPYSTIQPSYLVQSGRPDKLRTNAILKLLHHLRRCFQEMSASERQAVLSACKGSGPDDIASQVLPLLKSRLMSLAVDADASNTSNMSTLERLLPALRSVIEESRANPELQFTSGSVEIEKVDFTVQDYEGKSFSQLSLTSLAIVARMRSPSLITSSAAVLSQTSLRDRGHYAVRQLTTTISVGDVNLTILPHLMRFAQQILRTQRRYGDKMLRPTDVTSAQTRTKPTLASTEAIHINIVVSLRMLRVEAAAENLIVVFGVSGVQLGSSIFAKAAVAQQNLSDQSMNHSMLFEQIFLRARSNVDSSRRSDSDILASLLFSGGKCSAVMRLEPSSSGTLRVVLSLAGLELDVPRSAIRLYHFVEEWRADFLPGIEATLHELLSEIENAPAKPAPRVNSRFIQKKPPILHLHGHVSSLGVSLQVMHGTWLSWNVNHIVAYLKPSTATARNPLQSFGLQLASQVFSISYRPNRSSDLALDTRAKLELPTVSISGRYSESVLYTLACVDFFHIVVKPSHWDTLLAVQQKFGQDFNDLVSLVEETRRKRVTPSIKKPASATSLLKYSAFLKMKGFRVGLEGISSTLFLECDDIGGGINNDSGRAWNIGLSDLALSLAPRIGKGNEKYGFNRNHRSAFVIIDFQASAGSRTLQDVNGQSLRLSVTKIHAVMQPSSIGEIGDFIDHLQAEMLDRKERRAAELEEFKQKTKSVMRTFDVKAKDSRPEAASNWLTDHTVDLTIKNIGVAFPLALNQDLELPQTGSHDSSAVRAFLFSIKSLVFGTQRGETGQAVMKGFSFQFISRFRQSVPADFSGQNHQTRNRLVYPEMTAQIRSETSTTSRKITMSASVSGFILDIDSSIPDDVFSLIDVYRQGQERVTRLTDNIPRNASLSNSTVTQTEVVDKKYAALPTSSALASLTFLSGKVRVYSGAASTLSRTRSISTSTREPTDEQFLEFGADIFRLPVVSVWAEYRATPAAQKFGNAREIEPSTLMFKSTIHSSQNTLRPTLLPFITEVVEHVEARMRKTTWHASSTETRTISDHNELAPDTVSSLQISFTLRIDQSRLELTCQPDVNVIAGLHWDSGGFVINVSPGARNVTFTGSVGGLTVGLKHGFLSEECVRLDARNLAFSLQFSKRATDSGDPVSSVSVVLDTQFSGGVRFSRLQDVLCFKAVWLDRIPVFNGQQNTKQSPSGGAINLSSTPQTKQEFTTAVLVRIREIKLEVDLGQSISAVSFDLKDALIRTKLTEELYEVSLSVADVAILARGNISGRVTVPDCLFQTIRRKEEKFVDGGDLTKMLELSMTSGPLDAVIESDHQKLLQYHAEPLEVNIFDDWSLISHDLEGEQERPLRLSFTVSGAEVVAAATVGTIPKLLSYVNKFKVNMNLQREGASRESKAFQMTQSQKPDNPLSDVANAMLHSARDRFKEAEVGLSYIIEQHLSLRLDSLRLAVFPRTMGDLEMAQFIGSAVHARLDRKTGSDGLLARRILHLSFASMTISKYSQLNHNLSATASPSDGNSWLTLLLRGASEAIIVGLPSMNMAMSSEESLGTVAKELLYDFNSKFVRREGMRNFEDIFITLNMSLYSWLTVLRKNLTREMGQVQAASDWRSGMTHLPSVIGSRKKALEPLHLHLPELREDSTDALFSSRSSAWPLTTPLPSAAGVQSPSISAEPQALSPVSDPGFEIPDPGNSPVARPIGVSSSVPLPSSKKSIGIVYRPGERHIERLNMRQLGEATPDVMHPFFMKKAGFNLEDSLPQYVHEYATIPIEQIMQVLLRLYSKQLRADRDTDDGDEKSPPLSLV